jgi:formylglycine-generating enzyme required for sulfatase activity
MSLFRVGLRRAKGCEVRHRECTARIRGIRNGFSLARTRTNGLMFPSPVPTRPPDATVQLGLCPCIAGSVRAGASRGGNMKTISLRMRLASLIRYFSRGSLRQHVRSRVYGRRGLCACETLEDRSVYAIDMPFVTVNDLSNQADLATGYGAVDYAYSISSHEVTIGQYAEFLNAVAKTDPYGLWNSGMSSDLNVAGISRSGTSGSFIYSVLDNSGDSARRPITYVSWFDAARFANWMSNGQGDSATDTGAYTISVGTVVSAIRSNNTTTYTLSQPTAMAVGDQINVTGLVDNTFNTMGVVAARESAVQFSIVQNGPNASTAGSGSLIAASVVHSSTAHFWIPTLDEWYKAAFYSPLLNGGAGGYWTYATQSNAIPGNTPGDIPNNANYYHGIHGYNALPNVNYLSDVGAFSASGSYYGTFDQSGGVAEWNESLGNPRDGLYTRGVRGGDWQYDDFMMRSYVENDLVPTYDYYNGEYVGFRIAALTPGSVPDAPPPPAAAPDPIGISPLIIPGKLPMPPIGVNAVPVDGGVLVWWGYTPANPVNPSDPKLPWINHDVEYSVDGTTWTAVVHTPSLSPFQYVPTSLDGKALIFRVRGINGYGVGSYGYSGNYVIPGAVASPALQYISLAAPVSDGGRPIIGYIVQVSYDNGTTWKTATSGGPLFNSPFAIAPISDLFAHNAPARDNRITALDWERPFVLRSAAVNQVGISPWSLPSDVFNKGSAPTPKAVPNATVAIDKGTPTVSLSDVPHGAIAVFTRKTGDALWSVSDVRDYDTTQFVVPNLDAGLSYDVKIQALNGWGLSVPYSELSVSIPYVPGISSTISGNGSVSVAWTGLVGDSGSPITDYIIQYSSNGGLSWTPFSDGKSTLTTATVTGLANGTSYVFHVAAVNDAGTGSWSVNSSAVIPCTVPAAPANVIGTPGNSQVLLTWTAPLDNGGSPSTDYVIQHSSTGTAPWTTLLSASTATSATVTGLTNGTSYVFRVAAVNAAGTGTSSIPVTVIPRTVPAAPISLIGTPGNGQVSLSWTAPADNGGSAITDYTIQYSTNGGATWTISSHSALTATTATVTGLTNGTSYVFQVAAVNGAGTGAVSDPTPRVTPLPAVPGRPTAAAGNGFVILRWAAPRLVRMPPITDYAIRYSSDNGSTWTLYPHIASAAASRRLILTNGNTYIFQVAPVVSGGVGVYSARSLPVTPFSPAAKPDAPSGVVGVKTGALISLSWNPVPRNAGGPVIDYLVQYRVNTPKARWVTHRDLVSPATSASLRLRAGYSYVFRIAAKNLAGTGGFSTQSTAVTA